MRAIVTNFLRLEILNHHPVVYWGLAAVWFLILVSAFMSVRSLSISTGVKSAWFMVIVAIPILGLAAYAFRCIASANWKALKPLFQARKLDKQMSSAGSSDDPASRA
jgi:hypothetical protein